ncbi:hypothetical protein QUF80_16550 [Desulfococcaceae bacterium HSG8]|nr:hypothetical protein [Desulfococcaceae bacterium HSG8]
MKEDVIERYGFGVMADKDEMPDIFSHSDRILVIDMKNRKEIIHEEYRLNPHAETCRTKYTIPTSPGEGITDEELEIYKDIAELVKDCKYTIGYNLGYFPKLAMEKTDTLYVLQSVKHLPRDHIKELIKERVYAGFRD